MVEKTFHYSESELIAYVKGNLSAERSQQISADCSQNPDLAEAIQWHAHLNMLQQYPTLRDDLAQLKAQNAPIQAARLRKRAFFRAAAAIISVVSLFGAGRWLYKEPQSIIQKQRASVFTKQFLNTKADRYVHGDLSQLQNQHYIEALTHYKNKDYEKAETALMPIYNRAEKAEMGELGIYIATCRLKTGKYQAAKMILITLLQQQLQEKASEADENLINALYWHLALVALGEGDWKTAQSWLQKISVGDDYTIPAKEMLQQMERQPLQ